jgi:hypothetical protein
MLKEFGEVEDLTYGHDLPIKGGVKLCRGGTSDNPHSDPLDVTKYHYRGLIGGLNYISCCTRPDITFVVNQLARYSNAPTKAHWDIAVRVLGYLKNTVEWGISLGHGNSSDKATYKYIPDAGSEKDAVAYTDANHGTGIDDKRSITGMVLHVYGGPVSWSSKTQALTATSSCESEYRAMSETSREALWLAKIIKLFGIQDRPFTIRGDNKSAINSVKHHSYTRHTRHVEIHHDFMKDRYQNGDLDYEHISGKDNPADILTKSLASVKFEQFRFEMGMRKL